MTLAEIKKQTEERLEFLEATGLSFHAGSDRKYRESILCLIEELLCLRSVLSEWDFDKSCYVQWNMAEELRRERENEENARDNRNLKERS